MLVRGHPQEENVERRRGGARRNSGSSTSSVPIFASNVRGVTPAFGKCIQVCLLIMKTSQNSDLSCQEYTLAEKLGRGGFGDVYSATTSSGLKVAIKMISKVQMNKANMASRVANEVEIHWQLNHPAILALHNYFEDKSYVYLVIELCSEGELFQYLQKRQRIQGLTGGVLKGSVLSEEEIRGVMRQVVEGVMYLHDNGIIHRDLKLSNLLLTEDYKLKIADFGLAAKINSAHGEQKTMCGTPNYISPEIVSRLPYGLASDVWSLGCMFVTLLTGTPPFESKEVKTTLDRVTKGDYTLPSQLLKFPHAVDLIQKMLQKNPTQRISMNKILQHPFFNGKSSNLRSLNSIAENHERESGNSKALSHENKNSGSIKLMRGDSGLIHTQRSKQTSENTPHTQQTSSTSNFDSSTLRNVSSDPNPSYSRSSITRNQTLDINSRNEKRTSSITSQNVSLNSSPSKPFEDTLPEFTTSRLKPIKQTTKHGTICILQDGRVVLEFLGDEDILVISSDSSIIDVYPKSSNIPNISNNFNSRPSISFTREALTSSYHKKYRYAVRFVDLVRSKTPKIIFYSPQAKCMLMENGPLADFDMNFYNGIKVHNSTTRAILEFHVPPPLNPSTLQSTTHTFSLANINDLQLPPHLLPVFRHVQECLAQCSDIERTSAKDTQTKYPLVLRAEAATTTSSTTAIPSTERILPPPPRSVGSSSATAVKTGVRSSVGLDGVVGWKFLDGVGWCTKERDARYVMLFCDGIRVVVDGRRQIVEIYGGDKEFDGRTFAIEKALPEFVKKRLAYLPRFLKV
ncbi:hypothetical protein HK096_001004 [Nowakowskiella sp. JEL0078]|nr:hypothetical protein HK096_001004 [Nowakowskiella sp. JEL0078]